jgi:hypothetical protein
MTDNKKNVFISHYGEDDEHVQKFKAKLLERGYELRNSSIDSTKPNDASNEDYIKQLLSDGISWAGTFICLVGPETHTREWVSWEIEQAHKMGKQILGIYIYGAKEDSLLPPALEKYETLGITGWNTDKIIEALEGNDVGRCDVYGNPKIPSNILIRVTC